MRLSFEIKNLLRIGFVAVLFFGSLPVVHAMQEPAQTTAGGSKTTPEAAGPEEKKEAVDENDAYLKSPGPLVDA